MIINLIVLFFTFNISLISGLVELEADHVFSKSSHHTNALEIYCYKGSYKAIHRIWETVQLQLSLTDGFDYYDGTTHQEVLLKFKEEKASWNFLNNFWKRKNIRLNPFNQTCVGVYTDKEYNIQLHRLRIDYWKVLYLCVGIFLLFSSPRLAKNKMFYYFTGTSVGSIALILFLIYLFSRLFPRKPIMYTVMAGGSSVFLYLMQLFWENMRVVLTVYKAYFFSFITFTSLISFIVSYRFGPVSDPRSMNLIQWTLQAVALALVFISSEFQEASIAIIILLLTFYNMPKWVLGYSSQFFLKTFSKPKPRRLLSEDEFYQQSVAETNKALNNLRHFCSSPECNQWKTMLRLKNPLRFASFVQGNSHLSDDEILAFETSHHKALFSGVLTDDDSDSD